MKHHVRSFLPIADEGARILILGSMPGVASLAAGEYYAHPRNAFWPLMGELVGAGPELPYDARCEKLRVASIAVWDVLRECRREGSLDARIETATEVANDFSALLNDCPQIERIGFNGQKAETAFHRHVAKTLPEEQLARLAFARLPSTSPAHASLRFEEKLRMWKAWLQA